MSARTTILFTASLVALGATLIAPATAAAQKPPKRACGLPFLPLVEGNKWIYEPVESPVQAQEKDNDKKRLMREKNTPVQPKKIIIEVKSVEVAETPKNAKDPVTTITLSEKYDDLAFTTTLVCTKTSLDVDPYSIFFAAQPGGALQMTLSVTKHTGHSFTIDKRGQLPKNGTPWNEELEADIARTPAEGTDAELEDAKLNVWRASTFQGTQQIDTSSGSYPGAQAIQIELGGKVVMKDASGEDITIDIPANTVNFMWFDKAVGAVQFYNSFGHMYQLVETNVGQTDGAAKQK